MARTITFKGSSNVRSATLGADGVLEVTFATGPAQRFSNVTDAMMTEWEASESAGRWFHNNVRSKPKDYPHLGPVSPPPGVPTAPAPTAETPARAETESTRATTQPLPKTPLVLEEECTDRVRAGARSLYERYIGNSGGLNYEGKPCPPWPELTSAVRSHWCATFLEASVMLEAPLVSRVEELERKLAARAPASAPNHDARPQGKSTDFRPWRRGR